MFSYDVYESSWGANQRIFNYLAADTLSSLTSRKWRTSTPETPAITLDAIRQLIADLTTAVEAQTTAISSASNLTRTPAVKTGNYKEFISCQPFCFNGTEGAVGLFAGFVNEPNQYSLREQMC
ncbi:hypothetical protein Tco_1429915 [Tanacetum coccineum]